MSLITFVELCEKITGGLLQVPSSNLPPFNKIPISHINGASVDVRLGQVFLRESLPSVVSLRSNNYVSLFNKEELPMIKETLAWGDRIYLQPGEFILAQTIEEFYLPNNIAAEFRLKSSVARAGLDQALAVWCDPGWNSSVLTLELHNNTRYHVLVLEAGMKIGQVVFFKGEPVPDDVSYAVRGQYNNDKNVTGNKGVK